MAAPNVVPEHRGPDTLGRLTALAARVLNATAAILTGPTLAVRSASGPLQRSESELRFLASTLSGSLSAGSREWLADLGEDPRFRHLRLGFAAAVPIRLWDGTWAGALVIAGNEPRPTDPTRLRHLTDLASLAASEIELELRRGRSVDQPDRRRIQEQLLEKTLELAKFSEDLRQLHRLSTTNYESLDLLLHDYLETGRIIMGLNCGAVMQIRGRYAMLRAVRTDSLSLRAGMTFDLNSVYCGLVADRKETVAYASTPANPEVAARPHYGPVRQTCYIGAPILVDGEIFGVISFSSAHARWREFTLHEIEIIELMAKSIGRCLLETRMQLARERAEALEQDRTSVLELVAKDQPLDTVLQHVAQLVERQAPSLTAAVHLVTNGKLFCKAAPGMPESYRSKMQGISIPDHASCCFHAALSRRVEVLQDPQAAVCGHEYCWQACGGAPILSGSGEVLGVLAVYWRVALQPRYVDPELLAMASHLAAIAIEHRRLADRLAYQGLHDQLTGLPNRTLFARRLEESIASGRTTAVIFLDLDRFKQINDHLGHAAGDAVLRETAARLQRTLLPFDSAARLGGDEFVVLLENLSTEEARVRARAVLDAVREPIEYGGSTIHVTASVGLSLYPEAGETAEALLANADLAMYRVKDNGRNDIRCFAPGLESESARKLELEHSLRRALEFSQFELYFQPIVDIRSANCSLESFEVLLGWEHPGLGRIPPSQFIPIAEECGMIAPIGAWVLVQACRQCARWHREGLPGMSISVNVSPLQFARPDFVATVRAALEDSGLPGESLQLELTETAIMENGPGAPPKLAELRQLGVRLAIDDFGTGYSSLGYLRWLPVESLKIDRSFIAEMEASPGAITLVQTIVDMAHNLGLTVVAEGVETTFHLKLLRDIRCDKAQGHLFGHPMTLDGLQTWLERRGRSVAATA